MQLSSGRYNLKQYLLGIDLHPSSTRFATWKGPPCPFLLIGLAWPYTCDAPSSQRGPAAGSAGGFSETSFMAFSKSPFSMAAINLRWRVDRGPERLDVWVGRPSETCLLWLVKCRQKYVTRKRWAYEGAHQQRSSFSKCWSLCNVSSLSKVALLCACVIVVAGTLQENAMVVVQLSFSSFQLFFKCCLLGFVKPHAQTKNMTCCLRKKKLRTFAFAES